MSVFIVAEAGINHLGDRAKMLALCDAAKAAGADAVKFQAYDTDALLKRRGEGDRDLLQRCELSDADLDAIAAHCKSIGLKWFASVFQPRQARRILSRDACALKIGHAEVDYTELREQCRYEHGHPKYITTYISNPKSTLHNEVAVLCQAEYPSVSMPVLTRIGRDYFDDWQNDRTWPNYRGFSSHYTDYRIPAAAALRGAEYIEAHLKLSDNDPEAAWSLCPDDFAKMVKLIREYETWL